MLNAFASPYARIYAGIIGASLLPHFIAFCFCDPCIVYIVQGMGYQSLAYYGEQFLNYSTRQKN